jgi:hypothetical protein
MSRTVENIIDGIIRGITILKSRALDPAPWILATSSNEEHLEHC